MAASLAPTTSSTPATSSSSNNETEAKLSMTPSTGVPSPASPAKSGSIPGPNKEETPVDAPAKKPAKRERRRDRKSRPKAKPKKRETAQCVGYYVDALDKKMLWGEARIIRCNLSTQKIRVHFVGWSKTYDLWTDPMSITAHGHYAPITKNDKSVKSWDGDMDLFQDMLGSGQDTTPVPDRAEAEPRSNSPPAPDTKKASSKKKASSEKKEPIPKPVDARPPEKAAQNSERVAAKRKAADHTEEKTLPKDAGTATKSGGRKAEKPDQMRNSKPAAVVTLSKETIKEKVEPTRNTKRQKREAARAAVATTAAPTAKTSALKKKRARSPDELPLFRDLELDDGTVLDFSAQREEARAEREAMHSFLDNCALIWKKQLGALSVQ